MYVPLQKIWKPSEIKIHKPTIQRATVIICFLSIYAFLNVILE